MPLAPARPRAIALRETLIALAVVAAVAVVGLGAGQRLRERARATACLSILERYGVAFAHYTEASGGFLPYENVGREELGYVAWFDALSDHFAGENRFCPSADSSSDQIRESYRMNSKLSRTSSLPPRPFRDLKSLDAAGATVLLFDAQYGGSRLSLKGGLKDRDARHRGAVNVLFADWHVERMDEQRLVEMSNWLPPKITWDPRRASSAGKDSP